MYRLNTKLIVTLAVGSVLFVAGVFILHRFQVNRSAETFLERATAQKAKGETQDATMWLRAYLHHRPEDAERHATLALWSHDQLDEMLADGTQPSPRIFSLAYGATQRALLENEGDQDLCEAAIKFYLKYGRTGDAVEYLRSLIDNAEGDPKPEWLTQLAICYIRTGEDGKAEDVLSQAVGYDRLTEQFDVEKAGNPELIEAYAMLASVYENNRRDHDAAVRILNQMVVANEDNHEVYLIRARFIERSEVDDGERDQAAEDLAKARELAPEEADVLLASAEHELRAENFETAKLFLDECLEKHSDQQRTFELLQNWAISQADMEQALKYIAMGLEKHPGSETLAWAQANLLLQEGDLPAVEKAVAKMEELKYPRAFREFLRARLMLARQQWLEASKLLTEIRPFIASQQPRWLPSLDMKLAQCYERLRKPDMRLEALRSVVEMDKTNITARVGIIHSLLALGQQDKAFREYDRLEEQFGDDSDVPIRWGPLRLQFEILRQTQRPDEERVWDRAEELVGQLEADESMDRKLVTLWKAQLLQAQGSTEGANELRDSLQSEDQLSSNARLREITRTAQEESPEAALAKLDALVGETGNTLQLLALRADLARRLPPLQGRRQLAEIETGIDKFTEAQQAALYKVLGNVYLRMGEIADAQRSWREASTIMPGDVEILILRFDLAQQTGDEFEMERVLEDIGDRVGRRSSEWKWAEATRNIWLARNGRGDDQTLLRARGLLEEAKELRPNWYVIPQTEAQIWLIDGDTERAIASLQETLDSGPPRRPVVRQLLQLLDQSGRIRETERYLAMIDQSEWGLLEKLIDFKLKSLDGQIPQDIPIDVDSDNPRDHMLAGQVLVKADRLEEAEKAFRRAVKAGPMLDDGWRALVEVLMRRGKQVDAENATRSVELYFPAAQAAPVLASCYALMKDFRQALHFYNMALENNPGDLRVLRELAQLYAGAGRFLKAKNYLERIIANSPPNASSIDPNVAWARRLLAEVRAQTGTYEGYKDAVELIEANVPAGQPMRPDELALLGRLAIGRPEGVSRRKAIERFEESRAQRALTESELFDLAKLYRRSERWVDCKDTMGSLLSKNSKNEKYLQTWLDWLLEENEIALAKSWLPKLNQNSVFAIKVQADLLARQNRPDEVMRLVQKFIPPKDDPRFETQVQTVALLLERLGRSDEQLNQMAEKLWRNYVQRRPSEMIRLANFLATQDADQNRLAEAFDALEKSRESSSSLEVHQIALRLLRRNRAELGDSSEYYDRLRSWLDEADRRLPDSKKLAMQRTEFEDMLGNYDTVERLYREFLQRPDVNQSERALISNNLGYVLALKGNRQESLALVNEALDVIGPSADLLDTRAMIHLLGGDVKNAIDDLKYALADGGANAFKLFHLAYAYMRAGELGQAQEAYEQAVDAGLDRRELNALERQQYDELLPRLNIDLPGA